MKSFKCIGKFTTTIFLATSMLVISQVQANILTNGDFASCDLSGWQTDTDGFAGGADDFAVTPSGADCRAEIYADYTDSEVFFANTLYQQIDTSVIVSPSLMLSMDVMVGSETTSQDIGFVADYFFVLLHDGAGNYVDSSGTPGELVAGTDIDGTDTYHFDFTLTDLITPGSTWFLEFQLLPGADMSGWTDMSGSFLAVDNVVLLPAAAVSAPGMMNMLALFLLGIVLHRKSAFGKGIKS